MEFPLQPNTCKICNYRQKEHKCANKVEPKMDMHLSTEFKGKLPVCVLQPFWLCDVPWQLVLDLFFSSSFSFYLAPGFYCLMPTLLPVVSCSLFLSACAIWHKEFFHSFPFHFGLNKKGVRISNIWKKWRTEKIICFGKFHHWNWK